MTRPQVHNIICGAIIILAILIFLIMGRHYEKNNLRTERFNQLWDQCIRDGNKDYQCFSLLKEG